jgi:hypothetical protein
MNNSIVSSKSWLALTAPIVILLAIATGGGLFINGLYRDVPYFAAQAKGQDLVSLIIVLPTLIVTALLASRNSPRALLIWLGALVYLVYTYAIAAFAVKFNAMFLVYVALFGCSLYALIGGLNTTNITVIQACFTEKTPAKTVSIYLAVLMVLFYILWLSEILPALIAGAIPQSIQDNGTPTNAVHVLDMAWILPACGITTISLWRKKALGYTLAGAILSYCVLLILAILGMVMFMVQYGQPIVLPQVVIFGVLFVIGLGILILYMKGLRLSRVA